MASLARANLVHRKARSLISILAVGIGIALLVVLVGLAKGTLNEIAERMQKVGADLIVHPKNFNPVLDSGLQISAKIIPKLSAVPGVKSVCPVAIANIKIKNMQTRVFGIDPEAYEDVGGKLEILEGRNIREGNEMAIDKRLARAEKLKLGDTISRLGRRFKIVGIYEGAAVRIFIPLHTIQEALSGKDKVTFFFVKCNDPKDVDAVAARIESKLNLKAFPTSDYHKRLEDSFHLMCVFISAINAVCLLVSFLVILLAMYTTILERTREIGILKSLGATKMFIVKGIISESLILCTLGIMAGFALVFVATASLKVIFPLLTVQITVDRIATAIALGIAGGVLGALYPALKAARLDPVQALGYE